MKEFDKNHIVFEIDAEPLPEVVSHYVFESIRFSKLDRDEPVLYWDDIVAGKHDRDVWTEEEWKMIEE